jgi:nucleotide-binding universal stress UspA family protein
MTTTTNTPRVGGTDLSPAAAATHRASHTGFPLLLALRDDAAGDAALAMTQALASERGATPTIVHVVELGSGIGIGVAPLVDAFLHDPEFTAIHTAALRKRYQGADGVERWPIEIRAGDAAAAVVELARETRAQLIVMGLRHHGAISRAAADDTVHEVMRSGVAPVLAVPAVSPEYAPTPTLPARVMVAIDFSAASIRAAKLARRLMDSNGVLYLAHVKFPLIAGETERYEGMHLVHRAGIDAAFEGVVRELATRGLTCTPVTLDGDPVEALRTLAERMHPDLVAIGSQRHNWLDHLLLGSVARSIASDARWPVLVTPPLPRPPAPEAAPSGAA